MAKANRGRVTFRFGHRAEYAAVDDESDTAAGRSLFVTAVYVGTLGFEKRLDMPLPQLGSRWIEVAPPEAPVSVALVAAHDGLPAGGESGIRFTTDDATALHAALTMAGVDVDELLTWPGVPPMFAFRDPDGNGLEIVQRTPSTAEEPS